MAGWRGVSRWDLPGPTRFLERVTAAATGTSHGVAGIALPTPRPDGVLDAVVRHIEDATSSIVTRVDAGMGLRGRSPLTLLAGVAGLRTSGLRSVEEFLDAPDLSGTVFLVDGIPAEDWYPWAFVLKQVRSERSRRSRMLAPALAVILPPHVGPDDARAALGGILRWSGQVSRLDTQTHVEQMLGWPGDSLLERTAVSVAVEISGWDLGLVEHLAAKPLDVLADPRDELARMADMLRGRRPCWANGMVDRWDGQVWVHTGALASAGRHDAIAKRVWRGQVRAVFPFLDQVRTAFVARYEDHIAGQPPVTKDYHGKTVVYDNPWDLEFFDINALVRDILPEREAKLMADCIQLRRNMAHWDPAPGWRIQRASNLWEMTRDDFPDGCAGWEWPRCEQKLVLLVGPSGAGKTTWARQNCDPAEVVSSDQIRTEMFGTQDMGGDQEPVFERLRAEVVKRMSNGRTAIVDATNLRPEDRLANVRLVPPDMAVEYVVIDRPMPEKMATAEWRADKPGILEAHAALFERNLDTILNGDDLGNVRVHDLRRETVIDALVETVAGD